MNCPEREAVTADFLASDLAPDLGASFHAHLAQCDACRLEVEGLLEVWSRLDLLPEEQPSPALRAGFYARLEAYRAGQAEQVRPRPGLAPLWKGAAAAGLLAAGLLLGLRLGRPAAVPISDTARVEQELDQMRRQASFGLLGRPEAGERLKGLALVGEMKRPDPSLRETLLDTLERDDSVPVRLAAVDALFPFADAPGVRERITTAMQKESSPLVQAALIDLLVGLREKRAAEALRKLAGNPAARPEVRERARAGLEKLL